MKTIRERLTENAEQFDAIVTDLLAENESLRQQLAEAQKEYEQAKADAEKYRAINTPEIEDFLSAVHNEALHQRERWGSDHDAGKTDPDWFWLIGHLAGKALLKPEKSLHHIITTAAVCLNWHAAKMGAHNKMRPGIDAEKADRA